LASIGIVAVVAIGCGLVAAGGSVNSHDALVIRSGATYAPAIVWGIAGGLLGAATAVLFRHRAVFVRIGVLGAVVFGAAVGLLIGIDSTLDGEQPAADIAVETEQPNVTTTRSSDSVPPRERSTYVAPLGTGGLEGTVILLGGLALLVGAAWFLARRSELRATERSAVYLGSDLLLEPEVHDDALVDDGVVAEALERALASMLERDDPRSAIRAAYGTMLHEFESIELGRRSYEAPVEHMRRCLTSRSLPVGAVDDLVQRFVVARFSAHHITAADVAHARRSLAAVIEDLRSVRT
jgi:hypothetical protein